MVRTVQQLSGQVSDAKLKQMLEHSVGGIQKHTDVLKSLIQANGGETKPEHCKGMEGLAAEALKHGIKEAPSDGKLRDVQIIAQYQRMSHYGLAGFGTAAASMTTRPRYSVPCRRGRIPRSQPARNPAR